MRTIYQRHNLYFHEILKMHLIFHLKYQLTNPVPSHLKLVGSSCGYVQRASKMRKYGRKKKDLYFEEMNYTVNKLN